MHKGRAVRSTVGNTVVGCLAGLGGANRPFTSRVRVCGGQRRATSEIDKTPEPIPESWMLRESDSAARTRGTLFLTA